MTSRERIGLALQHRETDRIPLDLGGSAVTGMQVDTVYRLRQALRLDQPGTPVKVVEPYQMLGDIKPDLMQVLGVDVVGLGKPATMFGFKNEAWKPWTTFEGTPVLVPEGFNTEPDPNGDILMYPEGDRSVPASGRMPKGGFYFDAIVLQPPLDEQKLNVEDNLEKFGPISEKDLAYLRDEVQRLHPRRHGSSPNSPGPFRIGVQTRGRRSPAGSWCDVPFFDVADSPRMFQQHFEPYDSTGRLRRAPGTWPDLSESKPRL